MKIGIDSFTIRELKLDPYRMVDYVKSRGLDGVQFDGGIFERKNDPGYYRDVRQYADEQGIITTMAVSPCNPLIVKKPEAEHLEDVIRQIEACAAGGWHELRAYMSAYDERYAHPTPWAVHLEKSAAFLTALRPTLERCGTRINLENHGETTFDLLRVIEKVGTDICGICLDTANTLVNAEDPVLAAKRVAPYTNMTHLKDGILSFTDRGVRRQGKAPGQGIVDFKSVLAELGKYAPDIMLAIEDHKWLFEFRVFERDWIDCNPDLTPYELGQYMKLVVATERKIAEGVIPDIDTYETIPFMEEMEDRLASGIVYLRKLLKELQLV
ncbi:MAG: hypothetical protein K0Q59_2931 [Paenibacillus sp.]|nr:hypothetical protein [Paenibacillus sp.]